MTITLTPASGSGPFYGDANGRYDGGLAATSSFGDAVFANVDPGDGTLRFDVANGCTVTSAA